MCMRTLFVVLALWAFPLSTSAAVIYLDPPKSEQGLSDTFILAVRIDTEKECVNAARVEILYPIDAFKAVDFSRGDSILSLWTEEPVIDTGKGMITFSGGIPGGYCGRIPGDPVISNILGEIVFTVVSAKQKHVVVQVGSGSLAYLNDGLGTKAPLTAVNAELFIQPFSTAKENPWLSEVGNDTIPPEGFEVIVESTSGVFGGNYYAVFSTSDKQSGLDHYEIFERGVWKQIVSPYKLRDQSLRESVQVKAIDKAGNERVGMFTPDAVPERQSDPGAYWWVYVLMVLALAAVIYEAYRRVRAYEVES